MILYIHGFASCGLGQKSLVLREHFGAEHILAPDLDHRPAVAIAQLEDLLSCQRIDLMIGSSLGGYYATWLNRRHALPTVLINPAIDPARLLAMHIGTHTRWCDDGSFEFGQPELAELRSLQRTAPGPGERYLVLLGARDEVLDHREAMDFYRGHQILIDAQADHRFSDLPAYLDRIAIWKEQSA